MGRRTQRSFTLEVRAKAGAGGGIVQGGVVLLGPYSVVVDDRQLDAELELQVDAHDGRLAVRELVLRRRPGGPAPTAATLRSVALDSYLARSLEQLPPGQLGSARQLAGGHTFVSPARGRQEEEVRKVRRASSSPSGAEVRRQQLERVAKHYRHALELQPDDDVAGWRRRPTQYVAHKEHVSRGRAGDLLTEARRAGLLGPARPGRAGEGQA